MIDFFDQKRGKVEQANSQWDPSRSFPQRDANDCQIDVLLLHFNIADSARILHYFPLFVRMSQA